MNLIIITVTDDKQSFFYDLEVPCDLAVEKLIQDIVETLNGLNPMLMMSHIGSTLVCRRNHMRLLPNKTLNDSCVRNGDYVIISQGGV
jgi:uncharacterized ubiquitin-like protein YukD